MKGPLPEPAGESVRDDLVMLIAAMRQKRMAQYGRVTACLFPDDEEPGDVPRLPGRHRAASGGDAGGAAPWHPHRGVRADLDIEMTVLMLSGPTLALNLLRWDPHVPDEHFAETLVDAVLRARPRAEPSSPGLVADTPVVSALTPPTLSPAGRSPVRPSGG